MRAAHAVVAGIVLVGAAQAGAQSAATAPEEKSATFNVSGMACSACKNTVERAAKTITGVKSAKADQPKGSVEITFDPSKVSVDDIAKQLTKASGFKTDPKKTDKK